MASGTGSQMITSREPALLLLYNINIQYLLLLLPAVTSPEKMFLDVPINKCLLMVTALFTECEPSRASSRQMFSCCGLSEVLSVSPSPAEPSEVQVQLGPWHSDVVVVLLSAISKLRGLARQPGPSSGSGQRFSWRKMKESYEVCVCPA